MSDESFPRAEFEFEFDRDAIDKAFRYIAANLRYMKASPTVRPSADAEMAAAWVDLERAAALTVAGPEQALALAGAALANATANELKVEATAFVESVRTRLLDA